MLGKLFGSIAERFQSRPGGYTRVVKAGESFVVPAGTVHDAHNSTDTPVRLVGVYVVEKGKPLATPAP